jgi:DNA-binding MarR family transcriptional regulator
MISDSDEEFEEIPRNRLLTTPKIILYKLVFDYFGEMPGSTLKKILKRGYSQVSQNVAKLVNNGFIIKVNKNRRIQATDLGINHIQEHFNKSFKDILDNLNFFNNLEGIDEKMHRQIELVIYALQNPDVVETAIKNHKIEKKRIDWENYQNIYDRVETGNLKDTLMEKVFEFCNKNADIDPKELQANFEDEKPQTVRKYYNLWFKITLKKSKLNE